MRSSSPEPVFASRARSRFALLPKFIGHSACVGALLSLLLANPLAAQVQRRTDRLPSIVGLGVGGAEVGWMAESKVPWTYRYQYLSGGVGTGQGWANWNPNGTYVEGYVDQSERVKAVTVFTYYQLLQSAPSTGSDEPSRALSNLNNPQTMSLYYADFALLMRRLANAKSSVVVHLEPDLNGYVQRKALDVGNRASAIPAAVSSSGFSGLEDLPNTYEGSVRGLFRLRDRYAPNVMLAAHISTWSTGPDVGVNRDRRLDLGRVADTTLSFLRSLPEHDLLVLDPADRDAAYSEQVNKDGGSRWWDTTNATLPNFNQYESFINELHQRSGLPILLWQIPVGNTVMQSVNNSWNHYQDNRAQYWLGGDAARIRALSNFGVVGLLFGRGADGNTSFDDRAKDGVTNPAQINGNTLEARVADDDGGYLRTIAGQYYRDPVARGGGVAVPATTRLSTVPPVAGSVSTTTSQAQLPATPAVNSPLSPADPRKPTTKQRQTSKRKPTTTTKRRGTTTVRR